MLRDAIDDNPKHDHVFPVGSGSGFCIASGNYIMTNHHVIRDAKKIMVHLNDSTKRILWRIWSPIIPMATWPC